MKKGRRLTETSLKILNSLIDAQALDYDELLTRLQPDNPSWDKRQLFLKLYNLKRKGFVTAKKRNNVSFFHLAPKGRLEILKYLHLERLKKAKWDGRWRVIIFDIPERIKKWREYLRGELKRIGFHPLQESVYITPYPVTGELDELLKEWNLRKHFRYLTVSEIDNPKEFKIIFGLN